MAFPSKAEVILFAMEKEFVWEFFEKPSKYFSNQMLSFFIIKKATVPKVSFISESALVASTVL